MDPILIQTVCKDNQQAAKVDTGGASLNIYFHLYNENQLLLNTRCMLCFLSSANLKYNIEVTNSLDLDQTRHFVGTYLCSQGYFPALHQVGGFKCMLADSVEFVTIVTKRCVTG